MPDEMTTTATADGDNLETQVTEQVETGDTGQVTEQQTETQTQTEKTFTQAQLDEIIQKRLSKEQTRFESERKSTAQQARDAYIAEQRYEWPPGSGKLITTEAEYQQAMKENELMQSIQSKYANVPDELLKDVIEGKRFREQYQTQQQQIEEQQRQAQAEQDFNARRNGMYEEFLSEYPDIEPETIPREVWGESEKWLKSGGREGRRLADALMRHNWKQGQAQEQATQANQANATASTGSARGQGTPTGDFISADTFEANKSDPAWVQRNFNKIMKSRAKW